MACGMPAWKGLLYGLLEEAKKSAITKEDERHCAHCELFIGKEDLPMAANILTEIMAKDELYLAIQRQFDISVFEKSPQKNRARMAARMRNLVATPWAGVITTNYDSLIEHGFDSAKKKFTPSYSSGEPAIGSLLVPRGGAPFLAKLHGSSDTGEIVLSADEYDRAYLMRPQIVSFLTAVMLRYHLVFVGCSLEGEILRIRRRLFEEFAGRLPVAYALLPDTEENRARVEWLKTRIGIEMIPYRPDLNHSGVDKFLTLAKACVPDLNTEGMNSVAELRQLSAKDRMKKIGTANRDLLQTVHRQTDQEISHLDLVNLENVEGTSTSVEAMSPEERVYRVLFLVGVGLLTERRDADGRRVYGSVRCR